MQQLTITGYLSKDAETNTVNGDSVARLNVPVKQGWGEREQTNWYRVNVWGKRADFAGKLAKGDFIAVTGELTIGEYNGKAQFDIRAGDFQTVKGTPREATQQRQAEPAASGWGASDDETDIPF